MMELKKFLTDIRFLIPAGFLLCFELFMQAGLYRHALKPKSYAANVNNIVNTIANSKVKPNVLILGTSVAYQGVNLPYLNLLLEDEGLRVQSGATEGAMLITQHAIFKNIISSIPDTKIVLHFSEVSFPWTARYTLDVSNRSMLAQFPRKQIFKMLADYEYEISSSDYSYFLLKSITYRADLSDFITSPLYRIKLLSRENKNRDVDFPYENTYVYSMAVLNAKSLDDCVTNFPVNMPEINENGVRITDRMHMEAMYRTCRLAMHDPMDNPGGQQWKDLYFKRLKVFMDDVSTRNIHAITVFPPYSELIVDSKEKLRLSIWEKKLEEIRKGKPGVVIDLRRSLDGPDNNSLYYDTIHLNREGSLRLTEHLAEALKEIIKSKEI